jgi:hypothetical protein
MRSHYNQKHIANGIFIANPRNKNFFKDILQVFFNLKKYIACLRHLELIFFKIKKDTFGPLAVRIKIKGSQNL